MSETPICPILPLFQSVSNSIRPFCRLISLVTEILNKVSNFFNMHGVQLNRRQAPLK